MKTLCLRSGQDSCTVTRVTALELRAGFACLPRHLLRVEHVRSNTWMVPKSAFSLWAFVLMLGGVIPLARADESRPLDRFVLVAQIEAVQHSSVSRSADYPWLTNTIYGGGQTLCGFKRVKFAILDAAEYAEAGAAAQTFEWSGLVPTNRDCSVPLKVREVSLLIFTEWEGERYTDVFPRTVYRDGDGKLFVSDEGSRPRLNRQLLSKVTKPGGGSSCVTRDHYRYGLMKRSKRAKVFDGKMCFVLGLYLEDLEDRLVGRPAS